jgi:membrane fusion protein, multidrug efflux system
MPSERINKMTRDVPFADSRRLSAEGFHPPCLELLSGYLTLLLLSLVLFSACSSGKSEEPKARMAVPVRAAPAAQKTIPIQIRTIGNVEAYSTVSIKAQVGGTLTGVHFKEGQDVRKGDPLFTIDSRPFEADLQRAQANLARDVAQSKQAHANRARDAAQLKNAELEARRFADLIREGIATQQNYDQARTNVEALQAAVAADKAAIENAEAGIRGDKAAVENARLSLGYCAIRSPMNGRTGSLMVNQGNLIKANDTQALVVINQISPIYVNLSVPENDLNRIRKYASTGKLTVEATIPGDGGKSEAGLITFVDNAVDRSTGTIRLKGIFANQERRLWPGQFVQVALTLAMQQNAVVVPAQAVQAGQKGQYVFVVKPDLSAEVRSVAVGATVNGETVIEKGIQPGEKVVTDGQLRLVPGAKVEVKSEPENPQPPSPNQGRT